jgi:hypothetical protein
VELPLHPVDGKWASIRARFSALGFSGRCQRSTAPVWLEHLGGFFLSNIQVGPRNDPIDQYQPEPVAYDWSQHNIAACTGQHYVETAEGESECWAFAQGSLSYHHRLPAWCTRCSNYQDFFFACVVSVDVHGHRVRNGACGNCVYAHRDAEGSHPMDTGKFLMRFIVYLD